MQRERMKLAEELWQAKINAEFGLKANPGAKDQYIEAAARGIPFVAMIGESELAEGVVTVKDLATQIEVRSKPS